MSEKIVLIDGHSILNRAFYGVPELTNAQGLHTNAVFGFLNILFKILDEEKADYLAVAFDLPAPTFRHKMYDAYKGTRKPMPEELREQVPVIRDILTAMEIPVVTKEGMEADDILGTIAFRAQDAGMEVTVVSGDRDLLQLATDKILIRMPKTKRAGTEIENYYAQDVTDTYGITPKQVIDLKGLQGDASDNIPGVPGVGEKTAKKLLAQFPSVEQVYAHLDEVEPARVRELLRQNKEKAFLSKDLATIRTDCDIDFSFAEAAMHNLFTAAAYEWIKKLELKSLERRFDQSIRSGQTASSAERTCVCLRTRESVDAFFLQMADKKADTAGVGFLGDEWKSQGARAKERHQNTGSQLGFVFDKDNGSCVIAPEEDKSKRAYRFYGISVSFWEDKKKSKIKTACMFCSNSLPADFLLARFFAWTKTVRHICLFDWKNVMHLATPLPENQSDDMPWQQAFEDSPKQIKKLFEQIFDVCLGAYLLNPLQGSYAPEDIAGNFLGQTLPSYENYFGKESLSQVVKQKEFTDFTDTGKESELSQKVTDYLGNLSDVALLAYEPVKESLSQTGTEELFTQIEIPTAYYLYGMEQAGIFTDGAELKKLSALFGERALSLETDIYNLAGEEFNINSPKQLGEVLFEKMKLPHAKKTKTGYSTSAEVLEKLKNEDPIVARILEYRQVTKLKSTYADGLFAYIEPNGRIYGKFNQTSTATGRISSTDPNLQNIPIRMELGQELRRVFKPREGFVFLDADYSQIELRVLAHMSEDEQLIEAYRQGKDIHKSTASKVFHTPFDEVTDIERRNAKAVNFGIVYGISAYGLSQDLNISQAQAKAYIDQYFAQYPAVKDFIDGLVKKAKDCGYSQTMFGRRRPIPELSSSNYATRSFGERVAMNAPIQGTAADIIKIAMVRVGECLRKENLKAKIVLQVHDELLVETESSQKERVREILETQMRNAVSLLVPLEVEVMEGKDWKEAH